jgi:hypothetical protein
MFDTTLSRIIIEVVSAVICFILIKFMIKPYQLTKETRFLGLPFGFGLLGASFAISAIVYYSRPNIFFMDLLWFQSLARTFAFVFLVMTYYFSKKSSKNTPLLSNITFSVLVAVFISLFLALFIVPRVPYVESQIYIRVFNVVCLSYVSINTLISHVKKPDPAKIHIPLGFILLGISEYSLIFWYTDISLAAFAGSMALRLASLSVFLIVSYRTFYNSGKEINEKDFAQR